MLNKKLKLALIAAAFIPAVAFAEEPTAQNQKSPQVHNQAAVQIADINERLALLTAQLAELEMKTKIADKQVELSKAINPSTPSMYSDNYVPSVDFIDGVDGKYKASLFVQGGNTQSVRVGDKVGAWKVKEIKMDSVTVQKGKEIVYLGFGAYNANPSQANSLNNQPFVNNQVPQLPR